MHEVAMSDEMDEIWALYADDGAQALDAMESALLALGNGGSADAAAHVSALFRAVHTFKGNSRVLGLAVVESRAHYAEDLIGLVRDQGVPWDAEIKDILLLASDTLRVMLEETAATRADVAPESSEGLMTRLKDKIARASGAAPAEDPAPAADPAPPPEALAEPQPEAQADPQAIAQPEPEPEAAATPEPEPAAPAPAEPVSAAPAPQPEPAPAKKRKQKEPAAPAAAPAPAEAAAAARPAAAPAKRLADDPAYREIFRGMAEDATRKLSNLLDAPGADPIAPRARREVDNLAHAARQMGLDDWVVALQAFPTDPGPEALAALLLSLADLSEQTFGIPQVATPAASAPQPDFFGRIRDPLSDIARFGTGFFCGETPDPQNVADRVAEIRAAAADAGYARAEEAAARIPAATTAQDFHAAELRLYEELAAIEAVLPEAARASGISPREMLQVWCAEHVFSTLSELEATLDRLRSSTDLDADYLRIDRLLRLVFYACGHHRVETAGQLSMSLIDLFSRLHARGETPDPILAHVARGFIDTIELVFDAITQGQTPDTASLEKLFEEASNICFVQGGLMTASAIERRLGLPKEFHRVLSPESVRAASEAIEEGLRFFIVRADINSNERLAEAFIDWLSSGSARSITNVTVFQGDETLFDFLLASAQDEAGLSGALAAMDPPGRQLRLTRTLVPTSETPETAAADPEAALAQIPQPGISAEMVEQIGEIAASQSMISHMLTELAENDLFDSLDALLRTHGNDWKRARAQARATLTGHITRLQELAQLETQLVGQITRLQEETVQIRSRRIETIFRPLEAFIQTHSRRNRREAAMSFAGGELTLDLTILENLRRILRNLAVARLEIGPDAPRKLHISFHRDEERVLAIFEDDGSAAEPGPALEEVRAAVLRMGGELRQVALPGAGMRFHVSLPLAMVVLEGMVVGVDGVRYVVPVDAIRTILQPDAEKRFRVSAAEGREMLRIGKDEIVPIQALPGPRGLVEAPETGPAARRHVFVVLGVQGRSVAVPVDELIGQQLVLLRPLKGVLSGVQNMTGIALLAGGDVGMVVSANLLCAAHAPTHTVDTSLRM
jgi:two-component system chemotaxis sensor kinase CheA